MLSISVEIMDETGNHLINAYGHDSYLFLISSSGQLNQYHIKKLPDAPLPSRAVKETNDLFSNR